MYDFGEPFEDTGIDSVFTIDEPGYNPNGTEGNGNFDIGETFLVNMIVVKMVYVMMVIF